MITPVEAVSVLNEYGFYHNKTLGAYYEHAGVDFAATAGTSVFAAESGVVESIYKDDLLLGTEIVLDHGDGLKTVYRFVTEAEGLKVGDRVEKGDVIATVAEANGNEYKDGAHLHFEVLKNGKNVDPAEYLTLEEK
jgi:murein DD-endopeptidase MepM/ murein hydrolase activator NlpD